MRENSGPPCRQQVRPRKNLLIANRSVPFVAPSARTKNEVETILADLWERHATACAELPVSVRSALSLRHPQYRLAERIASQ
jgi:hypothetical protein